MRVKAAALHKLIEFESPAILSSTSLPIRPTIR